MNKEKIELGYRNIGEKAHVKYYHKFLLYTNKYGEQYTISGWTGSESDNLPMGKIQVLSNTPFTKEKNQDHPDHYNAWFKDEKGNLIQQQKQYRKLIIEGVDLSNIWQRMKYLNYYAIILLFGLSACANHENHQTISISQLSTQQKGNHMKTQSIMFNEILEKYPSLGIGETKSANDIIYKYIQLGMTKQEVIHILTSMHHKIYYEENNQLYVGYSEQPPSIAMLIELAGIRIYFKFNQEDKLESIDSEVRYYQ